MVTPSPRRGDAHVPCQLSFREMLKQLGAQQLSSKALAAWVSGGEVGRLGRGGEVQR